MGTKQTEALAGILESISDSDKEVIHKEAEAQPFTEGLVNTKKKGIAVPEEAPTVMEKKLASIFSKNVPSKGSTENIKIGLPPVEGTGMIEKKASFTDRMYDLISPELEKNASSANETKEDLLEKVAEETLSELGDLDKLASALVDAVIGDTRIIDAIAKRAKEI